MRISLGWAVMAAATSLALGDELACQGGWTLDGFRIDNTMPVARAAARDAEHEGAVMRPGQAPSAVACARGCGLAPAADGQLVGIAHGYKAVFAPQGLDFTPALGQRAPQDMPLHYRLSAAGRGETLQAVAAATQWHTGNVVHYERGSLVETYEVRPDGVKQSFVFTQLPSGSGDLVVRGLVATELTAGPVTDAGVRFELPGVGGVQIGAVLGIDALGRQVQGAMRCTGGTLEFSLPASFVDRALLPLTVDPLVGSVVTLGGANDDTQPDLAWDATTATWLAVWRRDLSATNLDIRGQRLDGAGALIGNQINIETDTATLATTPRVANVNGSNAFVVVWAAGGDIFARGVLAASGSMSAEVTVASGSNNQISPDISGEAVEAAGNTAFVVWADTTLDTLSLRLLTITAGGTLTLGSGTGVSSGFLDSDPSISQSGGPNGFHLVTWTRNLSGNLDIRGRIWNRTLGFVTGAFAIESSATDCSLSANDGDGFNWVVAYARTEAASTDRDIVAVSVEMHPSGVTVGTPVVVEGGVNDDETSPSVAWIGNSALVAYADLNGTGNYDTYVDSIDPFQCVPCEGRFVLDVTATTTDGGTQIGTRFSGGTFTSNEGACIWQSFDTAASTGDIDWVRFRVDDGSTADLGGGCGSGGVAYATCGRSPNSGFQLRLRRAAASSLGFCVIGFDTLGYTCGPCSLIPDPFTGLITTRSTDVNGDAIQALAVPSGVAGNAIILQWLVPGTNCFTNFDLSNAVRVTIQ